jgi:hypothetical protein
MEIPLPERSPRVTPAGNLKRNACKRPLLVANGV